MTIAKFLRLLSFLTAITLSAELQAQISIASARSMPLASTVTISGIVTNGPELGTIRYMQDGTAGIGIYDFAAMGAVMRGDSITVTGELDEFRQLLEVINVTVTVHGSGYDLPEPVDLDVSSGFVEAYESQLVRIESCSFTDAGGAFSSSSANYEISDPSGTGEVRVNGTTNIAGTIIPTDAVDLVGIMSQYDFSDPAAGYQLLPRGLDDFESPGDPPVISTVLSQSNLSTTGFTVSFETLNDGNTIVYYGENEPLTGMVSDAAMVTEHSIDLTGLNPATLYWVQAASISMTGDTSWSAMTAMATVSESSGWIEVYFNSPVDHSVSTGRNALYLNQALDDTLIAFIEKAQTSLEIAIYNLDNDLGVITAINDAYSRGVNVRLVANEGVNSAAWSAINIGSGNKRMSPSGSTPSGGFYGLMHNKFIVVDAESSDPDVPKVWTGSTNWTDAQLLSDPNNAIVIQDQTLARVFKREFEEMFGGTWGPEKSANTPTRFVVGGRDVEVYFSASDDVENRIRDVIWSTDNDVHFAMFSWTRFNISYAIEDVVNEGAFAAGVIEDIDTTATEWTVLSDALSSTLYFDATPGIMHHKYLIADAMCPAKDPIALTGSSNFTGNGVSRSDENIVVIHDAEIANLFYQEWVQRYKDNGGTEFATTPADCEVVVEPPMGIQGLGFDVSVYPNPADRIVEINLPAEAGASTYTAELIDMQGRMVKTLMLAAGTSGIDVSALAEGTYFLQIRSGNRVAAYPVMVAH